MIELARSTWTEVAAHMKSGQTESGRTTAFLPFGALEQHGPHLPLSTDTLQCGEIARRLAERTDGILLSRALWRNVGKLRAPRHHQPGAIDGDGDSGRYRADEMETSMILAIDPDLVHPDRYAPSYPEMPADFGHRPIRLGDLAESGVFGDPRPATAAKGESIIEAVVANALELVTAFQSAVRG